MSEPSASNDATQSLQLPGHVIDLAAEELRSAAGKRVDLRPRSFAVLRLLAENAGRVVVKDEIIVKVWNNVVVTDDSLTQCIADIRKAIGDEDRRILRTVSRRGYLLVPSHRVVGLSGRDSSRPALAVLPFRTTGNAKDASLAVGVASELINELARHRDLKVIARDSAFALAAQPLKAQELGEQLGARYLVEGTAQRSKNVLVVDVQLVDARDGIIAWGDRFSANAADIPLVQRSIAARVAASLRVNIRETEKRAVLGRAPRDLGVYELTLRGVSKFQFGPDAIRAARADLEEAICQDPDYAPAWTHLAWFNLIDLWLQLTGEWHGSRLDEIAGQFSRAVELDPVLPKAHLGLGQAMRTKGDVTQALALSRRALDLAPSEPDNLLFLAVTLFESGDLPGAVEAIEQALEFHPLPPSYYSFFHAMILWGSRRFQEALDEADNCLSKAPQFGGAEVYRSVALVSLGRMAEAKSQLAHYLSRPGHPITPPQSPELASRFLADLQEAGWRPTVAATREAG